MAIEWSEDLATGINEIDNQHKEIFRRINGLLDACNQRRGKEEAGSVIRFLDDYVVTHFSGEERYMTMHNYPNYTSHKEQHTVFIKNLSALKGQLEKEGTGVHIVVATNHMVVDWLKNHIRRVDKVLGTFLKTKL